MDIQAIYDEELASSDGDLKSALAGTRTRVQGALQQTKPAPVIPGLSDNSVHALQTAHNVDLWHEADVMIAAAKPDLNHVALKDALGTPHVLAPIEGKSATKAEKAAALALVGG